MAHLSQTLEAISSLVVPSDLPTELIVVDNASTDNTAELIHSYRPPHISVKYFREARSGKSFAHNIALGAAQGEVLLFTDDDVRPPQHWIAGMCEPILKGRADAVAGGVRLAPDLQRSWMEPLHRAMLASTELLDPTAPDNLVGANMAFSRQVLSRVPAFDTELGPGALGVCDDSLFASQLIQAGYRITSAFGVEVEHHPQQSRLLYPSYKDIALKLGRSSAYISRHWKHEVFANPLRQLFKSYRYLKRIQSASGKQGLQDNEGIDILELNALLGFHFQRHHIKESRRPAKYEKFGLVKLKN